MRISDWSSDVCSSDLSRPSLHLLADGALLDALLGGRVVHDAVDVDAWQVHVVRVDGADLDDLFDLDDADLARHRAGRVEVARSLAEQQVAGLVGLPGLAQRHVGDQCGPPHVVPPGDLPRTRLTSVRET